MKGLSSSRFKVSVKGTHHVIIPEIEAIHFIDAGHTRVEIRAFHGDKTLLFHGKLRKYKDQFIVSFGQRYQKEVGVQKDDIFTLQLFEDTTKYGVEIPEEFAAVLESDPEALEKFEMLTDGKKRSLIYFIIRIKNSQTRIDKALRITDNLKRNCTDVKLLIQ